MSLFKRAVFAISVLLSIGRILRPAITGLALVVCLGNASFAIAASLPISTFEWEGRSYGENHEEYWSGDHWESLVNWIEVGWRVKVETKLEYESSPFRFYSIKSVAFEIPFQYLTFSNTPPFEPPTSSIAENYLCALGPSDFDLSFNLQEAIWYNCSCVQEVFDIPNPGDYYFFIILKHPQEHCITTPKGMTLKLAGNSDSSVGGRFVISHFSYLDDGYGSWVEGSEFIPPAGYYQNLFSESPDDRIGVSLTETDSLYKTVRFLDEEDESRYVRGAVADGRSRVIVELHGVTSNADATISAGDSDGIWISDATLRDGVWRRTWQSPESYGGSDDDNIQGRRPIDFTIVIDGQSLSPPVFNLYKVPVVLLHGLWGSPPDMTNLYSALKTDGYQFVHSVQYPYQSSFAQNAWVPQTHVRQALDSAINQGLVAKKADIVAYSMGGCIAKLHGHSSYIRRIVTIGTPHYGSPWADTLFSLQESGIINVEKLLNLAQRSIYAGAVGDLQEGSGGRHVSGNNLNVLTLAIAGIYPDKSSLPPLSMVFGQWIQIEAKININVTTLHTNLFGNDDSDWIVSKTSQEGGLSSVNEVVGPWHIEEPINSEVISDTIAFLDGSSEIVGAMSVQETLPLTKPMATSAQTIARRFDSNPQSPNDIIITSPEAGTVYSPGDTVHVVVSAPENATAVFAALSDYPFTVDDSPPFAMDITVPQKSLGETPIVVVGWDNNEIIGTASTTVTVTTTATVTSLKVWPDSVLYLRANDKVPFVVHGVFSDGVERDITTSQCGTAYATTDSSVATIDSNGVLTAKVPGYCSVIVSNCVSMQIPVLVRASAIIGDFNGDARVNAVDLFLLTNDWLKSGSVADIGPLPNGDGIVNFIDFSLFAQHWLEGTWLPIPGDLNSDGKIDFADLALFAMQWLREDCNDPNWCDGADFNHSGATDTSDLAIFTDHWLEGTWHPIPGDLNGNGTVDFSDFAIFANQWLNDCISPEWCYGADLNYDFTVDFRDFASLASGWLGGQ